MHPTRLFVIKLLYTCLLLTLSVLQSPAQCLVWAHGIGGGTPNDLKSSGNNNYVVGSFSGTVDFDPGVGVLNLVAGGTSDMYILNKDTAGNLLWIKQVVGSNNFGLSICDGKKIGLDEQGNIYIGGVFRGGFDFDPGPGIHQLYTNTNERSFVLKLNSSGDFIWVKDIGNNGSGFDISLSSMKLDTFANIFFTCTYRTLPSVTIDVDPGPGVHNVQSQNDYNGLIEKLDSAGNFIWAKEISAPDNQHVFGLTLDASGNIYATGLFTGTVDFDPGPGVANLSGSIDVYVSKYDSAGNYQWAGAITGGNYDNSWDIATDTFGSILVTGRCNGIADFDPGPGVYNSQGKFVLKLWNDGTFAWVKSTLSWGALIATDGYGNVFTAGNCCVEKFDSTGTFVWAKSFGSSLTAINIDEPHYINIAGVCNSYFCDLDPGMNEFLLPEPGGIIEKFYDTSLVVTTTDDTLCPDGEVAVLSTTYIPGATYTWVWSGVIIPGNSNTISVTNYGFYEVFIDSGCVSGQIGIYNCYGDYFLGVEETPATTTIQAYPNPFEDKLTVKGLKANDHITLIDITGRVVYQWKATTPTQEFTTNALSPGYYVLKVMNENGVVRVNVPVIKN